MKYKAYPPNAWYGFTPYEQRSLCPTPDGDIIHIGTCLIKGTYYPKLTRHGKTVLYDKEGAISRKRALTIGRHIAKEMIGMIEPEIKEE